MKLHRYCPYWILLIAWGLPLGLVAQVAPSVPPQAPDSAAKPVAPLLSISGKFSVTTDAMAASDYYLGNRIYRRPPFMQRYSADLVLKIKKYKVPVSFSFTLPGGASNFNAPEPRTFKQYLLQPGNRIGISPTFGKLQLFLGSHTAQISGLTAGNVAFLTGLGFAYTPRILTVKASYGITQRAVQRDVLNGFAGAYQREMLVVQVGLGNIKESMVSLQYVRARDSMDTLVRALRPPVDGAVASGIAKINLSKRLSLFGELAVSLFASDASRGSFIVERLNDYAFLIPLDSSLRADAAAEGRIRWKYEKVELSGGGKYVGPGYTSLAYFNQMRDYLDMSANAKLGLLEGDLVINANAGWRETGGKYWPGAMSGKAVKSNNLLLNATAFLTLSRHLSLYGSYNNMDYREVNHSTPALAGLANIAMLSNSINAGGTFAFDTLGRRSLNVYAGQDILRNLTNLGSSPDTIPIRSRNMSLGFQGGGKKGISLSLGGSAFHNTVSGGRNVLQVNAFAGLRWQVFQKKGTAFLQAQFSHNTDSVSRVTDAFVLNFSGNLRLNPHLSMNLLASGRWQLVNAPHHHGPVWMGNFRHGITYQFGK